MEADPCKQRCLQYNQLQERKGRGGKEEEGMDPRALRLEQDKQSTPDEEALVDEEEEEKKEEDKTSDQNADQNNEEPLARSSKDKFSRSQIKKEKVSLFDEDVIDGFAILSFTTLEELEIVTKKNGCIKNKPQSDEDTHFKDTNSHDKEDVSKIKKKKIKKISSFSRSPSNNNHHHDISGSTSDSNISSAISSDASSSSSSGSADDRFNHVRTNLDNTLPSIDHPSNSQLQHDQHNHQLCNGKTEPPKEVSKDWVLDAGTHTSSGQVYKSPELHIAVSADGFVNQINSEHNPCVTLITPALLSPSKTSPAALCNGITVPKSPVHHHVLVATTTATTATTTSSSSPTRPSLTDSLTTSTPTPVPATVNPSQSVIHPSPYLPDHQGLNPPSQLSHRSSISLSHNKRTLSPNSSERYQNDSNGVIDDAACARSLQYSKVHRTNTSQSKSNADPSDYSPNSLLRGISPYHPNPLCLTSENFGPTHLQNGPSNLNHQQPQLHPASHYPGFSYHNPFPAYTPLHRPESCTVSHSSPRAGSDASAEQRCKSEESAKTNNVARPESSTTSQLLTHPPENHISQENRHHHHHSSRHIQSSDRFHQNHNSQQQLNPFGYPAKRHCRTPPTGQQPSTVAALPATSCQQPQSESAKHRHTSTPTKPAGNRHEPLPTPTKPAGNRHEPLPTPTSLTGKDVGDRLKHKEGGSSSLAGSYYHSSLHHAQHHHQNHHHHHHHHQANDLRERDREREKDRDRASGIPPASALFPSPKPSWSSTPRDLYSSLIQPHHSAPLTPSPSLHTLVPYTPLSAPSSTVTPHTSPLFPLPLAPPPPLLAAGSSALQAGMFATPVHLTPHSLPSAPSLPPHHSVSSQFSAENLLRGQDFLHQDLNNRLLAAHHDSSSSSSSSIAALQPSPFVRGETHQHQHQHLHNHMHQHTYGGLSAGPLHPPAPPLIVPSYSAAFASLLPPGPSGASLASSLQGAFQPKNFVAPGQIHVPFRDREKAVTSHGLPPTQKKQGKWCAVHVRIAWEIYHRQQKKLQRDSDGVGGGSSGSSKSGPESKPLEPLLRPASHLFPGGGGSAAARPPESPLLTSARSIPDGLSHNNSSFLSPAAQLGLSPFTRPSPYPPPSLLNPLGFSGLGSSMFASVHDMVPPGLSSSLSSSPHEWSRLHRTPSSFPSWSKLEAEREKEREREQKKDEERERRGLLKFPSSGLEDSRHSDTRPRSRSRSRSPLVNGRLDHHGKSESGPYDKASLSVSSSALKLKEDRMEDEVSSLPHHLAEREKRERERMERDRLERERMEKEKLLQNMAATEREKLLQAVEQREKYLQTSGYLGLSSMCAGFPTHPGLLDRRVGLVGHPGAAYPFIDMPPAPASMWSPFDKSPAEIAHRLEVERERERIAMMSRLSSIPSHLAALEQERLKEQILREQQEREHEIRRQYLERLPAFTADRLRAVDPLAFGTYFHQPAGTIFGPAGLTLKSSSPHGMPGAPPPLIPSSSSALAAASMLSRSHDNSPSSSSKSKRCSPADSTSDIKDKREGFPTDPDAHLR